MKLFWRSQTLWVRSFGYVVCWPGERLARMSRCWSRQLESWKVEQNTSGDRISIQLSTSQITFPRWIKILLLKLEISTRRATLKAWICWHEVTMNYLAVILIGSCSHTREPIYICQKVRNGSKVWIWYAWGISRGLTRILRVFSAHFPRARSARTMHGEYASALRVLSAYFPRILRALKNKKKDPFF